MYTVSEGPITVKDAQKSVAGRKPKTQIQSRYTVYHIPIDDDDEIGRVNNEDIDLEL